MSVFFFLLLAKCFPRWDVWQKLAGLVFVIDSATVMLHSVADNQPSDSHFYVVSANLVKNPLTDGDMRRFVFDDHNGTGLCVINHCIATLLCVVQA